jgi:hypothetical protein
LEKKYPTIKMYFINAFVETVPPSPQFLNITGNELNVLNNLNTPWGRGLIDYTNRIDPNRHTDFKFKNDGRSMEVTLGRVGFNTLLAEISTAISTIRTKTITNQSKVGDFMFPLFRRAAEMYLNQAQIGTTLKKILKCFPNVDIGVPEFQIITTGDSRVSVKSETGTAADFCFSDWFIDSGRCLSYTIINDNSNNTCASDVIPLPIVVVEKRKTRSQTRLEAAEAAKKTKINVNT